MYGIQPHNNAVLSGVKSMPIKDSTSDGNSGFSGARHEYAETVTTISQPVPLNKKWFGSRDASDVASRRRVHEIGVGSLNAGKGNMSFMTKTGDNTRKEALARVRGGGYMVPPKVRNRPGQSGVPLLTPPVNVPVIRTEHKLAMVPTQEPKGKPYIPMKRVL